MRLLVISDIHGNIDMLNEVLNNEIYDRVIFLGDIYSYYGDYGDELVRKRLLGIKAIMVKGNVDNDLDVPIIKNIEFNNKVITLTHGHLYNEDNLPNNVGDILLLGHTHRSKLTKISNIIIANPGSIGKPRDGFNSYIIIDDDSISIKNIDKQLIDIIRYK